MARSPSRRAAEAYPRSRDDRGSYRRRSRSRNHRSRSRSRDRYDSRRDRDRDRDRDSDRHRARDYDHDRDRERDRDRRHDHRERNDSRDRRSYKSRRDDRTVRRYDDHRGPRRDDSRDGRRSKEDNPSPVRDSGRRAREEPARGRDSIDEPHRKRAKLDDGKAPEISRPSTASTEAPKPLTMPDPADKPDKSKQDERRAKLEAWKKEKEKQKAANSVENSDQPADSLSVQSPTVFPLSTASASPAPTSHDDGDKPASPLRSRFDPKAIKRRTEAAMAKAKGEKTFLEGDAGVPAVNGVAGAAAAQHKTMTPQVSKSTNGASAVSLGDARISRIGLNKASGEKLSDKSANVKATTSLDDDENIQRKFKKLPDMPMQDMAPIDMSTDNPDDPDADGDLRSDEEEAQASREAAQRRAEEASVEQADAQGVVMTDASAAKLPTTAAGLAPNESNASNDNDKMDVEEEEDPLDAFMDALETKLPPRLPTGSRKANGRQVFDDDSGPDLDAVGDEHEDPRQNKRKIRKEIPTIDHAKTEYEPFRKAFYTESAELAAMTEEEVQSLREELDGIHVRGKDKPKPISKWSHCGFSVQILDVIRAHKFENPTSIQSQALPAIMSGRDTIGIAKTGSGKTLAFVLPMFRHIKDQPKVRNLEGPIGLILAPTRELAVQIHRECLPYLKALDLRGACVYGGTGIKDQIAELKRGAEVVVATPGRLIDLLTANSGRVTNLRRVTYCVLDEADRMFDMGFEPQIAKILSNVRPDRQVVLFSATFPGKLEGIARKMLDKPIEILVGGRSVVAKEITQIVEVRAEDTKFHRVLELLGELHNRDEDARSLLFVEKQESADMLLKLLARAGYPSVSVHGGREQIDRDQAILDFKAGHIPIMVATSVAARGLDVKQLKLVINFDAPNHTEDYVHRAGRTGRAGETGTAVTFVTPKQEHLSQAIIRALQDSQQDIPPALLEMAAAHKKKVELGQAQKSGSGFGGKGIERLEAARDAERAREKKQFKTGDEADDDDDAKDKKSDSKQSELEKLIAKAASGITERDAVAVDPATSSTSTTTNATTSTPNPPSNPASHLPSALAEHLNNAKIINKVEPAARSTSTSTDPLAKVTAAAASINSRLGRGANTSRPGAPPDNRGPDAGAYYSTLQINDFPQKARWAVTNRTNVAKILEATGTSITSKGNFYPKGSEPGPTDPSKLYILVEGDSELAVSSAMRELTRHLNEGTIAAQDAEARAGGSGRYTVV